MALRALERKLLRDLWLLKGQAAAVALVIACGVATFVLSVSTLQTLRGNLDDYYERYRFAEVFAHVKRAPDSLAERVAAIPGVQQVQARIVTAVTLDVEGMAEPATGRLVSIPERGSPELNRLYLRSGRYPEPGREGEVLVGEGFAAAHRLRPGDSVTAILNGRKRPLRVVGVALSPEFIYQIREGDLLPDDRRYGVLWMRYPELAAAFDLTGAFNDLALTLAPGASEPEVLLRLDRLTAPYGGLGAYGRADQASHKFISNEMNELRGMAVVVPLIFLAVAAFILNIVLNRLVGTQREQIAALKAFGYTRREVGWHYLQFVLVIVALGVLLGTVAGARLGRDLAELYTRFFRFPVFAYRLDGWVVLLAGAVSTAAAVAGTLGAVSRATRLPPAEAMRPEPPASYRPTLLERAGLRRWLPLPLRMVLRQLERRPGRALLSALGISLAVAVLILGYFMVDALDYVMDSQFQYAERQDLTVTFVEPTSTRALPDLRALPGVTYAEPFRAVSVRLRHGHRARRLAVLGLGGDATLYRLLDVHRRPVQLPPDGVLLSEKLGELLGVGPGDAVTVEVLEGARPVRAVPVAGLIADFAGTAAYMDRHAVNRLLREGDVVSGAYLAADPARLGALYTRLKATPKVAGVTLKKATLQSFRQTIAENILRMRFFNILFASVIAFGVVYNNARIALAERGRELATLRVIGFTRAEISFLFLAEQAVLTLAAIPFGLLLGYGLAYAVIELAYDTELFRIPLFVSPATYAYAATVTLLAALFSGLVVRRALDRLDLVAVLKSKE